MISNNKEKKSVMRPVEQVVGISLRKIEGLSGVKQDESVTDALRKEESYLICSAAELRLLDLEEDEW